MRRLAVACDVEARPSLRLVPGPAQAPGTAAGETVTGAGADDPVPFADDRAPDGDGSGHTPSVATGEGSAAAEHRTTPDPPADPRPADESVEARAPRVCVLGDGRAGAAFARALAARLARAPGARCAVLARIARDPVPGPPSHGPARSATRRLARVLQGDGSIVAARGRLVELTLSSHGAAAELARLRALAAAPPLVLTLPASRTVELDALLPGHDLALLVVRADTPPALTTLAVADLVRMATDTTVLAVTLPTRGGGAARRAALDEAMEALR